MSDPIAAQFERALDEALARALPAPHVPRAFRARLNAALSRPGATDLATTRERLECERRAQLQRLEEEYVRIRRSTFATLVGAAFAAGAALVIAMPWLRAHLGVYAPMAITWGGVALGLGMTFYEPLRVLVRRWSDAL